MLASVWMMKMGKKALKSIKNLMSDRCTVQKKFTDEILQSYIGSPYYHKLLRIVLICFLKWNN